MTTVFPQNVLINKINKEREKGGARGGSWQTDTQTDNGCNFVVKVLLVSSHQGVTSLQCLNRLAGVAEYAAVAAHFSARVYG